MRAKNSQLKKALAVSATQRGDNDVGVEGLPSRNTFNRRPKKLSELVNAITPKNRHAASDWGKPAGKEIW